ncbi:MAG: helix-turn-helix domain-containing protein [Firmicutes bacterium]|nr:helix-turn-helix domain-containing protein [Bacillota bacterium]
MEHKIAFAESLKELMEERELSITQLSQDLECDYEAIWFWLKGEYYPRCNMIIKLCNYFGCSVDYILGISDDRSFKTGNSQSNFHERLDLLLKRKKWNRAKLSKLSGIGEPAISKWINNGITPEASTLIKLSQTFGCSIDYLLGRTN